MCETEIFGSVGERERAGSVKERFESEREREKG